MLYNFTWISILIACFSSLTFSAHADEKEGVNANSPNVANSPSTATPPPNMPSSVENKNTKEERNFYEVLNDIFSDFEYDLKNGNVSGLKDLSIRNVVVSENIPVSFKSHLELLATEKILKTTKTRMVQCLPCKAKRTTLNGDQVIITSPETNQSELSRIAKLTGISNFLDIIFLYQPTGIILSLYITDSDSGTIIWTRSYNSETSIASAFRRGVDYNQIDQARKQTEYSPTIQPRLILSYLYEPSLPNKSGCLSLGFRMVERYDNRKKEVGFEANYMADASTIVNSAGASAYNIYNAFGLNLSLIFLHAWNFIGEEENYNKIRGSILLGIGGTYAAGYLSGLVRTSYEWRLGKHYGISFIVGYHPAATAFVSSTPSGTISGPEYGLGVNILF